MNVEAVLGGTVAPEAVPVASSIGFTHAIAVTQKSSFLVGSYPIHRMLPEQVAEWSNLIKM